MLNLCVVIPSYNEARSIGLLIKKLITQGFGVYVVDDGSADDTATIAEREGASVLRHPVNMGKGAAMRDGFAYVLEKGYDAVIVMDSDGQHEVEDIAHFIKKMDESGADLVIGNRMADIASMPLIRIYTNRFMSFLISRISGQWVPDTQCGFRLIKREVLQKIELKTSKYEIESEMIIKACQAGFKLASVSIKTVYRDEKSRINPFIDTFRFLILLIKLALKRA